MRGSSRALGANQPRGMHVLAWLKEQGAITPSQADRAESHALRGAIRVEEALLETGALTEAALLKLLAARYRTQFVSTDRLAKAVIDRTTLSYVPSNLAEKLQVFPVVFDKRHSRLSVVVAAPGEDEVEKQVQVVSGVREVRSLVARPAAIAAAIAKGYGGNHSAFTGVRRFDEEAAPTGLDLYTPSAQNPEGSLGAASDFSDPFATLMGNPQHGEIIKSRPMMGTTAVKPAAPAAPEPIDLAPAAEGGLGPGTLPFETDSIDFEGYLETLNVFVSLLERDRGDLRGHTLQVAKLCQAVAERVGMTEADRRALMVAAYLHDVGKGASAYHLTALNVAKFEGHRNHAQKCRLAPAKLFESAWLPATTGKILAHVYERWDGQGFPDRLSQKEIPYGARVLTIVETYCDLIGNPQNPYRRVLSPSQASSVLRELGGTLFDPTLAELLIRLAVGEKNKDAQGDRPRALVVDADPEETTVLEMRLIEQGFVVKVARDLRTARSLLKDGSFGVVVTEVDFGGEADGFGLFKNIEKLPAEKRPEVIFLTSRSDRESVTRGLKLGAADYLVKPASPEVVAAKAGQAVESSVRKRAGGVSGSLKEMSLPDVIQILANGKRGGKLKLSSGGQHGEIHFQDGQIHDAKFGDLEAEDAVYALLRLNDGTFSLDPTFKPTQRRINTSPEGLLLEGMRRLDEGIR